MWDDLFDKKFREAANEGLPSLDKAAMWDNISSDLDQQDGRRKFAWIWFMGGLVLLFFFTYLVTTNHHSFFNQNFTSTEKTVNSEESASTIQQTNQTNPTPKTNTKAPIIAKDKTNSETESIDAQIEEAKAKTELEENNREKVVPKTAQPKATKPVVDAGMHSVADEKVLADIAETAIAENDAVRNSLSTALLAGYNHVLQGSEEELDYTNQLNPITVQSQQNKMKWGLVLNSGALLYEKNLQTVDPEFQSFVDTKNQSERELFGVSANLLVDLEVKPNFHVRTGLNYTSLYEQFEYDYSTTSEEVMYSEEAYAYTRRNGTVQTFGGDVPFQINSVRSIVKTNQHQMWNAVLEISMSKQVHKFKTEINTGLSATFAQKYSGKAIDTQLSPVVFGEDESPSSLYALNKAVGYWHIGAGLEYPLSGKISLSSDLNYRVGLNPTNATSDIFTQTYKMIGANIGMKFKF